MITLTWRASTDPCRQEFPGDNYAIYAGPAARPSLPPGRFPSDPWFTVIDTSQTNSYIFAPGPGTQFYLVLGIGRDGLPGPAGHY